MEISFAHRVFLASVSSEVRTHRAALTALAIANDMETPMPNAPVIPGDTTLSDPRLLTSHDEMRLHSMYLVQASRHRTVFGLFTSFERYVADVVDRCAELDPARDRERRDRRGRLRHEGFQRLAGRAACWLRAPIPPPLAEAVDHLRRLRNSIAHRGWQVSSELADVAAPRGRRRNAGEMLILADADVIEAHAVALRVVEHFDPPYLRDVVGDLDARAFVKRLQRDFTCDRVDQLQAWLAEFLGADRSVEWVEEHMSRG